MLSQLRRSMCCIDISELKRQDVESTETGVVARMHKRLFTV